MPSLTVAYEAQALDAGFGEHWSGPPILVDRIARRAGTRGGDVVVDVGCGVGGPARRLSAMGCRVLAVDIVAGVVREALRRSGGRIGFAVADGARLPLRARSADQVWCLGAAAHIADLRALAREAARVLRPGGTLVLTEAFRGGGRRPRWAPLAPTPWRALPLRPTLLELDRAGLGARALAWPALDVPGALLPKDVVLRRDLAEGRLVPRLILASKASA